MHIRYRAFTTGGFGTILEQDKQKDEKDPVKPAQSKKLGGNITNNGDIDPTRGADTIISYIRDNNLGKAATAIMSHGVAPVNEDTIRQVQELLNPLLPRPMWTDTRPNPTSRARIPAQIDITKLGGALRATPRRTAADIYGWNYEHLQTLIGEKEATEAMGRFLNHLLGGRLRQETLEDMSMVKVTPPSKRDKRQGQTHNSGSDIEKAGPLGRPQERNQP